MNLLSTILDRLNQRIEVGNIFDQIYGLSEPVGEGNDKAWAFYIGNGQAIPVTNFDAKQGTLFWAKRGKITVAKNDSLRLAGCKSIYETRFSMTAYAMVRKSHLPCDSADAQDWVASRVLRLISGTDPQFKTAIGVIAYEVVPSGYQNEIRYLPVNYEWAAVAIDVDVNVSTSSEDGCYDTCATGDIPLPDFEPCTPCLTEVAVDGITIIGNGTPADPLIAIGGGGGGGALIALPFTTDHLSATGNAYAVGNIVWYNGNVYRCIAANDSILPTNTTYWVNLGAGFPTVQQPSNWNATSGNNQILNKPTIPVLPATIVEDVTATAPLSSSGGTTPDISISQANTTTDGYLSSADWNTFDGKFDTPTGTSADYLDGTGAPTLFPTLTNGTVTAVAATVPTPTNPAFSVAVPNPNTTPSIDITANGVVSQYVRGDGSLANFPLGGGGGASVNYYLNGSISQGTLDGVAFKQMSSNPVIGGGTNFSRNTDGYIESFITDASVPNQLLIPAGNWLFEMYFQANNNSGSPRFYIELWKLSAGTLSLIASSVANPEFITNGNQVDLYTTALAVPSTPLLAADRLAIRVYVITTGRTITMHTEDNNLCQIITTFTTGLNALNGLTAQVQNFATGTTGTDFGISSASSTHTFNLPTASASNRGALSTTDWSTFNGKFNTPSGTISEYVRGDGTLATFPTLPTIYKTTADTIGYQGSTNTVVYTQLILANTFAAGDVVRVNYRTRKVGNANAQTLRIYTNTTANLTGSPILIGGYVNSASPSSLMNQILRHLCIKTSTNNTEVSQVGALGFAFDYGLINGVTTCAINWTINQYFVFAIQNAGATDFNYGSMYLIEKL
jgi:hypothetical protein